MSQALHFQCVLLVPCHCSSFNSFPCLDLLVFCLCLIFQSDLISNILHSLDHYRGFLPFMGLFLALFSTSLGLVCCTFVELIAFFVFHLSGLTEILELLDILFGCEGGNGEDTTEENSAFFILVGFILLQVFIFALLLSFLQSFSEIQMMTLFIQYLKSFLQFLVVG